MRTSWKRTAWPTLSLPPPATTVSKRLGLSLQSSLKTLLLSMSPKCWSSRCHRWHRRSSNWMLMMVTQTCLSRTQSTTVMGTIWRVWWTRSRSSSSTKTLTHSASTTEVSMTCLRTLTREECKLSPLPLPWIMPSKPQDLSKWCYRVRMGSWHLSTRPLDLQDSKSQRKVNNVWESSC